MSEAALTQLREALLPDDFSGIEGVEVEGRRFATVLDPTDPEALSRMLETLNGLQLPALVRGGGTRMGLGNLPRDADVVISTTSLSGVRRFEPDDGVIEVSGGTPLSVVRRAVSERGWELPMDAGGPASTVGGAIATAAYGPRCLAFGPVRRNVLGLEVVDAAGTLTKCGGRVVKNVTGYDLAKLYTGSLGTLGVITGAWLRLQPSPRAVFARMAEFSESGAALEVGRSVSRRGTARACVLLSPEVARRVELEHSLAASWILLVEFAGEEAECKKDVDWFEAECGGNSPADAVGDEATRYVDAIRDDMASPGLPMAARIRIATLPTKVSACLPPLLKAGALMTVDPGLGVVVAELRLEDPSDSVRGAEDLEGHIAIAREAAVACNGTLVFEALPTPAKRGVDVFGENLGPQLEVMRRLKNEFDPKGLLNPGRFVGGI